jgi:phosphate-selective porin OprO/OprP
MRSILAILGFLITALLLLPATKRGAQADSPSSESDHSKSRKVWERVEEGIELPVKVPVVNWHYYWKNGFRIDSPKKNLTSRTNLTIMIDAGYIGADDELEAAFPDLEGPNVNFRQLRLSTVGTLYDFARFKFEIDFANVRDIKDIWVRFTKVPVIEHVTLGHTTEPFSLESWTSLKAMTFVERSLPVLAFAPRRNIGIRRHTAELDQRMTWAVGVFLNTGSFSDLGEATDQMSELTGWNLTGRITYLPWYEGDGSRLFHLGLSYTHQVRDENNPDSQVQFRPRPESRLTDVRLVDTDKFQTDSVDMINPEFAIVQGPLSFQGEFFLAFVNADALGKPFFWGSYLFGSYFLTDDHRNYGTRSSAFFRQDPTHDFRPFAGGWGALELAARFSHVDLNDGAIRGGRELNFTAGLNWYLNRDIRCMLNYIRAWVKNRVTPPPVEDGTADIIHFRFQIEF